MRASRTLARALVPARRRPTSISMNYCTTARGCEAVRTFPQTLTWRA
jgi:hypothetical protein